MGELLGGPGVLGTNATLFSDLTLIAVIAVGMMFSWGVYQVRKGNPVGHHFTQIGATFFIMILAAWLMVLPYRDFVLQAKGGPRPAYFAVITTIHAITGLIAVLTGIFVVLGSNNLIPNVLPLARYKPVMRVSYGLFMAAILTGIMVYVTWYVILPTPPSY